MRVLHFVSCAVGSAHKGLNGTERLISDQFKHYASNTARYPSFSLGVLYSSTGRLLPQFEALRDDGLIDLFQYEVGSRLGYLARLVSAVRTFRPDVIHVQGPVLFDFMATLVGLAFGCKVMVTRHVNISGFRQGLKTRLFRMLDRLVTVRAHCLMSISQTGLDEWVLELGLAPNEKKLCVIYNGVDLDRYLRLPIVEKEPHGRLTFAIVAQLTSIKGHMTAFQALKNSKVLKENCELVVIGDGPDREALERYCRESGLNSLVTFKGFQLDIGSALADVHAVVLPSYREGFPLALVEAMAAGKVIIGTDVGAVKELFRDNEEFLVRAGDVLELGRVMEVVAAMDREAFRNHCKSRRNESLRYQLGAMTDSYFNTYKKLCGHE